MKRNEVKWNDLKAAAPMFISVHFILVYFFIRFCFMSVNFIFVALNTPLLVESLQFFRTHFCYALNLSVYL